MTAMETPTRTFRHGVHPPENKHTRGLAIQRMPFVETYVMPLSQHIGAPAKVCVKPGQRVSRGQIIGKPGGFISSAIHAPVTGRVVAIEKRPHPIGSMMDSVIIRTDSFDAQLVPEQSILPKNRNDLIRLVQEAGIVGLGGAAFPSHVKLSVPEGKKASHVIINGCECEPYLTCDHRLMLQRPEAVINGLRIIMDQVGAGSGGIGIERNKADAIEVLKQHLQPGMSVYPLEVKYPQGAEKLLIDTVLQKEVPAGGLPIDIELVSYNVGSAVAISDLLTHGMPLIERIVTVTGPCVARPANLIVPVGTPVRDVFEFCGVDTNRLQSLIMGGPMMGSSQKTINIPIIKGTSGLLCLDRVQTIDKQEMPCIRCGRCLEACPMFLNPSRLAQMTRAEMVGELSAHHILNCFECGACSFVCPSHIPLVHLIRVGKGLVKQKNYG